MSGPLRSGRIVPAPDPAAALAWLQQAPGGALALLVTRARGVALHATPVPDASALLDAAIEGALAQTGAHAALLWHADGLVQEGAPLAIAGAVATRRAEAQRAVDLLLVGLKGVARREDVA